MNRDTDTAVGAFVCCLWCAPKDAEMCSEVVRL